MAHTWVYYSSPKDGSNNICVIDFSNIGWSNRNGRDRHMMYREIFPGSIIHCIRTASLKTRNHTGIRYHMGEQ